MSYEFKDRLKLAMQVAGVKSSDVARIAGFDPTQMSHMINGQRKPGLDTLSGLLKALPHCDARWLICGDKK